MQFVEKENNAPDFTKNMIAWNLSYILF